MVASCITILCFSWSISKCQWALSVRALCSIRADTKLTSSCWICVLRLLLHDDELSRTLTLRFGHVGKNLMILNSWNTPVLRPLGLLSELLKGQGRRAWPWPRRLGDVDVLIRAVQRHFKQGSLDSFDIWNRITMATLLWWNQGLRGGDLEL